MFRGHMTRYMVGGVWVEKPKIAYENDKDAIEKARIMNTRDYTIHKLVAYKCSICGKWHVGRSNKVLNDKDREHYKNVIKFR